MSNETMNVYNVQVDEDANGKKRFTYPDYTFNGITLKGSVIKRICTHKANFYSAIIDAISSLIVQDEKLGVNKIGKILRQTCAVKVNNAVLASAVKGVKQGLSNKAVAEAMAEALAEVANKKATKKTSKKVAGVAGDNAGDDDLSKIKEEAVLTAVQLAESQLKARLASKLSDIVDAGRKAKDVNTIMGELVELISYLRASEQIIACKAENAEAIKASKKAKKAKKTKTVKTSKK